MIPGYEHLPDTLINRLRMECEEKQLACEGINCFEKAMKNAAPYLIMDIKIKFDDDKPT